MRNKEKAEKAAAKELHEKEERLKRLDADIQHVKSTIEKDKESLNALREY